MANDTNRDRQNPNDDDQARRTSSGQDRNSQAAPRKPGGSDPTDDQDTDDIEETDDLETPVTPSNPNQDRSNR